jgi:hypothetical protein
MSSISGGNSSWITLYKKALTLRLYIRNATFVWTTGRESLQTPSHLCLYTCNLRTIQRAFMKFDQSLDYLLPSLCQFLCLSVILQQVLHHSQWVYQQHFALFSLLMLSESSSRYGWWKVQVVLNEFRQAVVSGSNLGLATVTKTFRIFISPPPTEKCWGSAVSRSVPLSSTSFPVRHSVIPVSFCAV